MILYTVPALRPDSLFRVCEGVLRRVSNITWEPPGQAAGWNPAAPLRSLAVRLNVAELLFGDLALEAVNGALEDGGA